MKNIQTTRVIPRELIKHLEWDPTQTTMPEKIPPKPLSQSSYKIEDLITKGKEFESEAKNQAGLLIGIPTALREALQYTTPNGVVASMPYHIAGKAKADKSNYLWKKWFTALSEENVGMDQKGAFTKKGKPVVVVVHSGGILIPDRIEKEYDRGLSAQNTAKYTIKEFDDLLSGKLPSGETIEIYTVDQVKRKEIPNPFGRYGVALDFEIAKSVKYDHNYKKGEFVGNPLVLARTGTPEYLEDYFEKAQEHSQHFVRNWHRFHQIDYEQPQGRLLFVGNTNGGLDGYFSLDGYGRFVGVAPEVQARKK